MNYIQKLYRSRDVILEMLEDRGYSTENYRDYTIKEIDTMHKNMQQKITLENQPLDILVFHKENGSKLLLKYIYNSKIRVSILQNLIKDYKEQDFFKENDTLIIITKNNISNENIFDAQLENIYKTENVFVQVFWLDKLVINITKHELVPQHRILSIKEKEKLLEKFDITNYTQLPLILKTDPIAKFYGMKRGDVCEIKRPSETSGVYINYRYCQ